MIKNKLVMGLSTIVLVASLGGGVAQAKSADAAAHTEGDRIETQNPQYKGLKAPHSARKEAAKRLKVDHQLRRQHEDESEGSVDARHGHTEKGSEHTQNPSTQGGAQ
jgi:hypothetical protein